MTASGISRILSGAGFARSGMVKGKYSSVRTEGFSVWRVVTIDGPQNIVRVEHEFTSAQFMVMTNDEYEATMDKWLDKYKKEIETRGYEVRKVLHQYHNSLVVTGRS